MQHLSNLLAEWREYVEDERDAGREPLAPYVRRYETIQTHVETLREDPPSFDAENLDALLSQLESAKRVRRQIVEANEIDVLVPTLHTFLFGEEPVAERFALTLPSVRYAGPAVLGELFGWVHADRWPIFTGTARAVLTRLTGKPVPTDYLDLARLIRPVETHVVETERLAPDVPAAVELAAFLDWAAPRIPPTASPDASSPRVVHAIREFGAPYDVQPPSGMSDRPLPRPGDRQFADAERHIRRELVLPEDTIRRAAAHLLAGRHLMLTGAPGTGKSHLATLLASELFAYYPMVVTATAEWSAFDIVGGLVPAADADGLLRYEVRPGYVYEALRQNWLLDADDTLQRDDDGRPLRRSVEVDGRHWQGVWLIIDELNRADIDKAFGDLFTALETGRLRVPALGAERSQLIPLPKDFRILATLNTRDRHFLFTLSDALKRRFAFLELTPPGWEQIDDERATLLRRTVAALTEQDVPIHRDALDDVLARLHPLALFIRAFHPLGTAPLLAALRYAGAVTALSPETDAATIAAEAYTAEIVPQLEGMLPAARRIVDDVVHGRPEAVFTHVEHLIRHHTVDDTAVTAAQSLAGWLTRAAERADDTAAADLARRWQAELDVWSQTPGWPDDEMARQLWRTTEEARKLVTLLPPAIDP